MARVGRVALKALITRGETTIALVPRWPSSTSGGRAPGCNIDVRHARPVRRRVLHPRAGAGRDPVPDEHHSGTVMSAFADGNVLQVLLIAVLFGAALSGLGERGRPLVTGLDALWRRSSRGGPS